MNNTRTRAIERSVGQVAAALLIGLGGGCATPSVDPARPLSRDAIPPVVSVTDFANRTSFTGQWKLGTDMADLLVSELMKSRNFVVVERRDLGGVVGEIDRQVSRYFRPEGKVPAGRLKNARYQIRGVIMDFAQVGGGSLAVAFRKILLGGRGYRARVALTLTIVDVESGEVVASVQSQGTALARQAYGETEYKGVRFGGDAFFRTPLGEATADAIRAGVKEITRAMPRNWWTPMIAEALSDGTIALNGGSDRGFKVGALYTVRGEGRPVTDPVTGDVLSVVPGAELGIVRVSRVEKRIAYAEPLRGSGFARGCRLTRHTGRLTEAKPAKGG